MRTNVPQSLLFIRHGKRPSREFLKGFLVRATFRYLVPPLNELKPEQIMLVRKKVKDLREGFSMHLQKLSKGLNKCIENDLPSEEIEAFSRDIVETDLIPDYREFRRQLVAEKASFWRSVLDSSGKVFSIDAAPWTPKFWGEFIAALGFDFLHSVEKRKERLSNKWQAFQFMHLVEDKFKTDSYF